MTGSCLFQTFILTYPLDVFADLRNVRCSLSEHLSFIVPLCALEASVRSSQSGGLGLYAA